MKICLNWKIIVCGLFCVFPVDIKGRTCQCIYGNSGVCESCNVGCYRRSKWCYECPEKCNSCSSNNYCDECNTGYYGRICERNCNTCRNGSCDSTTCTYGCADGYYHDDRGGYCQQCINNCVTCNSYTDCMSCIAGRTGSTCQFCKVGYYDIGGNCRQCIDNCVTCNSYTYCTSCKAGRTGLSCQYCKDGYYDRGGNCEQCMNNCVTCNSYNDCTSCIAGRTGSSCQYCKDGYYDRGGNCQQCIDNCVTCNSYNDCTLCKAGRTGTSCQNCKDGYYDRVGNCQQCIDNCVTCNSHTDCTSCKAGSTGSYCQNCKDGYYRNNWQCIQCNTNCLHSKCDKYTGECTDGCNNNWSGRTCNDACASKCISCDRYNIATCNHCPFGHYGSSCDNKCSSMCVARHGTRNCSEINGDCNYGCVDGWTGSKCTDRCDVNCKSCDAQDKGKCHTCRSGFLGQSCENECSSNCAKISDVRHCRTSDGHCTDGCVEGWTGSTCREQCAANCTSCDQRTACTSCKTGLYGHSCNIECSEYCVKTNEVRHCKKNDGHCTDGCVEGWTGSTCREQCNAKCTTCDRHDGIACTSCKPGYYGPSCDIECSEYCGSMGDTSRQCQQDDGTCVDDCVTGFKGDQCDVLCDAGCRSDCDRNTGICQSCKPAHFGPSCQHICNATCYDPGNDSNVCHQLSGECLFNCPKHLCSLEVSPQDTKTSVAVIGGAVGPAVMIVLVVAAVLVFMFHRKRRRKMSDPERTITYANNVQIEDENTDDNVYSVPDKKRRVKENIGETQSIAHCTLPKLPSYAPVTTEDVVYNKMGGAPVIPTRLGVHEPEYNVEELCVDEASVSLKEANWPNVENYYNIGGLTRSRVKVTTFRDHVTSISKEDFEKEFKKLPKGRTRPYGDAVKPTNVSKNRYKGIYPYDSTRVKLTWEGGDYINASYIQGFKNSEKTYIASSGPAEIFMKGYVEFWEMVWQEKVDKIVMLTNFIEESKMKCEKYWPDVGEHNRYGDIIVHCMSAERYADFTVTKLTMKKDSKVTGIHHYHFTAWPDRGTPENVVSLVEFRESVEHIPKTTEGPTVVHCSAGIGRTGTYIALDILIREGRSENYVDVYGCVLGLRGQRVLMIQNVEQYRFLHYALSHSLTTKCDQIATKDFCNFNADEIQRQFQLLRSVTGLNDTEEGKAIEKNRNENYRNRKGASIPGDTHRPRLFKYNQNSKSDYINAIYVDGYREKNRYIVAQTPLSETVEDFLGLALQENCSCIISLDPVIFTSKQDIGYYIPDINQEVSVGNVKVICVQKEITADYILSKLIVSVHEVRTEEAKTILHYQYTEWPEQSNVPSSTGSFLNLLQVSRRTALEPNMPLETVIIHCLAGGDRSGLFPVVANILEKINSEQQASIVNLVSQVRARRHCAIPNKEQFKYCYELASLFVENNSVYSNLL